MIYPIYPAPPRSTQPPFGQVRPRTTDTSDKWAWSDGIPYRHFKYRGIPRFTVDTGGGSINRNRHRNRDILKNRNRLDISENRKISTMAKKHRHRDFCLDCVLVMCTCINWIWCYERYVSCQFLLVCFQVPIHRFSSVVDWMETGCLFCKMQTG